jgi:hypothetical protein
VPLRAVDSLVARYRARIVLQTDRAACRLLPAACRLPYSHEETKREYDLRSVIELKLLFGEYAGLAPVGVWLNDRPSSGLLATVSKSSLLDENERWCGPARSSLLERERWKAVMAVSIWAQSEAGEVPKEACPENYSYRRCYLRQRRRSGIVVVSDAMRKCVDSERDRKEEWHRNVSSLPRDL